MSTAAQNIHVFRRKSPLHKNHFFEWLKTANFSTACGTVTLKSPLSRAFSVPDVHPRLRKCLSRCTLDCGFKTSESPALRGFVAERCPIRGTSLYLAFFFVLGKAAKSAANAVISMLPTHRSYGLQGSLKLRYKHPSPTSINGYHTAKKLLSQSPAKRPTFAFTGESGYTLGSLRKIAHKGSHAETGVFRTGVVSLPSERSTRFGNPAWPDVRTANFAAFGSWPGVLLKNAESLRDSDALMRVAVPRRRGPAGLRRPTPPAERTVLAPISPRVQLCLRRPAFPLSAFIPGA